MNRNDVKCQMCGQYIFNGLEYWCFEYAGECKTATSNTTKKHVFTQGTRREESNGYMLCPKCMDKYKNRCPVCDKLLTVMHAWLHSIPITLNGKLNIVKFTIIPNEDSFVSPTRFNITIGEVETNHIINFSYTDGQLYNSINEAILSVFSDCEWDWY